LPQSLVTKQTNTAQMQPQKEILPVAQNQNTHEIDVAPYINQHLELVQPETLQGRMPYVRAVSFEPDNN
jgi:hypothetical protein